MLQNVIKGESSSVVLQVLQVIISIIGVVIIKLHCRSSYNN